MEKHVTIVAEHKGDFGDGGLRFDLKDRTPDGYKYLEELTHEKENSHIHVGLYELIPLPSIEEAAIAFVKEMRGKSYEPITVKGKALHRAVQRKLNVDG